MKWLVGLLVAGIVIFVILGIVANKRFEASREARQTGGVEQTAAMPQAEAVSEVADESFASNEAGPDEPAVPLPDDEVTTGESLPQASAIIGTKKLRPIMGVAEIYNIVPLGIQTIPGGAYINATWRGDDDSPGREFLENLQTRKLIDSYDLDESLIDYRFDKGRKLWTAKFKVAY